ncbi:MAG TPA: class I SAM-dependent methyltransferase [bacterium]
MSALTQTPLPSAAIPDIEFDYVGFADVPRRNLMQEFLEVPAMVLAMGIPPKQRMLEVGCGQGIALTPFFKLCRPKRLVGIDVDEFLIRAAAKRLHQKETLVELYCHDVRKLPFPDASFDVIVDFGTCYHISHRLKALKEIARLLTVGGIFVFETRINQFLSHPVRSFGRRLPWHLVPDMKLQRWAVMWTSRIKVA